MAVLVLQSDMEPIKRYINDNKILNFNCGPRCGWNDPSSPYTRLQKQNLDGFPTEKTNIVPLFWACSWFWCMRADYLLEEVSLSSWLKRCKALTRFRK